MRKGLPYYEAMFNKSDEESNATNSRSSRFPVPSKNSKLSRSANELNQGKIEENHYSGHFDQDQS
jgi:hypothetical protein